MIDIFIKIAAVVALIAMLFVGEQYIERRGYDRAKAEDQAATNAIKAQAAALLANATSNTRAAEQAMQDIKNTQELKDGTHQKTVADLSNRLRMLAGPSGRLRDPNAVGCGGGSSSPPSEAATAPGAGAADSAETGGLLSVPITELFSRIVREADDVNNAYASCRADAYTLRGQPQPE